jgi:hypothetical protein
MLFIRRGGVFHLPEGGTRNFGAIATVAELVFVDGAIVKRAHFSGQVFQGPEGLSIDGMTAIALVSKEFAIGADQSAGREGLGCSHHKNVKYPDKYNGSSRDIETRND